LQLEKGTINEAKQCQQGKQSTKQVQKELFTAITIGEA